MTSDRLFQPPGPLVTEQEREARRRAHKAAQGQMFDQPCSGPDTCPACAGTGDACTCERTGAQALELLP